MISYFHIFHLLAINKKANKSNNNPHHEELLKISQQRKNMKTTRILPFKNDQLR